MRGGNCKRAKRIRRAAVCGAACIVGLLAGLAVPGPATGLSAQLTARQILETVSHIYSGLTSYRMVEQIDGSRNGRYCGPLGGCPAQFETDLAVSNPDKLRLVVTSPGGSIMVISNGRKTWAYIYSRKQYMEADAAPLLEELWRHPVNSIGADIAQERTLAEAAKGAKMAGEETLRVGRQNVRCYVVDLPTGQRLWIDERHFLVLRTSLLPYWTSWTWQLMMANLGPIPNKEFQFEAPKGARHVAAFSSPPGYGQRAEEQLAGLLIGWEMLDARKGVTYALRDSKARDFTLASLGGGNVRLKSLRGKTVVLDFFASWCKPCRRELAAIQKLHDELPSKKVVFLGIDDESAETVRHFAKAHGYTFPILLDPKGTAYQLYGARLAPTNVVINRHGKVVDKYVGSGGEAQILKALRKAGLKVHAASARK